MTQRGYGDIGTDRGGPTIAANYARLPLDCEAPTKAEASAAWWAGQVRRAFFCVAVLGIALCTVMAIALAWLLINLPGV